MRQFESIQVRNRPYLVIRSPTDLANFISFLEEKGFMEHHSATHSGYIPKSIEAYAEKYVGRYGFGYIIRHKSKSGVIKHKATYYIKKEFDFNEDYCFR